MTTPGTLAELDEDPAGSVASLTIDRLIVVENTLPVRGKRRPDNRGWNFSWDEDSLLFHLRDGLPDDMEVLYVGSLRSVPAFLPKDVLDCFYQGFCKHTLWPLFHYRLRCGEWDLLAARCSGAGGLLWRWETRRQLGAVARRRVGAPDDVRWELRGGSGRVCHEEKRGQRIAFAAREEKHKISRFGFCGGNVGNIRPKLVEVVLFVHPSFTCNAGYHWLSARES